MLRHFNCASVDSRKEADTAPTIRDDAPAAASTTIAEQAQATTCQQGFKASTSLFATSSAPGDLVTLPPMSSISITCRLFGSNGKLLSHFEDDLELYPPPVPSGSGVSCVVRDPITFHIPVEPSTMGEPAPLGPSSTVLDSCPMPPVDLPAAYSAAMRLQQQHHQNNSYFDSSRSRHHRCNAAAPATTAVLTRASPLSAASVAVSTPPRLSKADATTTETLASCCSRNYYGSIRALHLEQQLLLPAKTGPMASPSVKKHLVAAAAASTARRRGRQSPQLLLLEQDRESGRTAAVGCVPSVPVARSRRLLTHKGPMALPSATVTWR